MTGMKWWGAGGLSSQTAMNWELRRHRSIFVGVALCALFLTPGVSAGRPKPAHPYRYSVVDMPVSLAIGTVRTPEFSVAKNGWYWIMIQVEKPLPFMQMVCMTGTTSGPLDLKYCSKDDPLLRADWVASEGGNIVLNGSSTTDDVAKFTDENIFKFIGSFPMLAGRSTWWR